MIYCQFGLIAIFMLDLTGGEMTFSYTTNTAQTFDTYKDRYLTN